MKKERLKNAIMKKSITTPIPNNPWNMMDLEKLEPSTRKTLLETFIDLEEKRLERDEKRHSSNIEAAHTNYISYICRKDKRRTYRRMQRLYDGTRNKTKASHVQSQKRGLNQPAETGSSRKKHTSTKPSNNNDMEED